MAATTPTVGAMYAKAGRCASCHAKIPPTQTAGLCDSCVTKAARYSGVSLTQLIALGKGRK